MAVVWEKMFVIPHTLAPSACPSFAVFRSGPFIASWFSLSSAVCSIITSLFVPERLAPNRMPDLRLRRA